MIALRWTALPAQFTTTANVSVGNAVEEDEDGPLMLAMYCFQRLTSGIMVGPHHAERTAANDDAHHQSIAHC